MKRGRGMKDRVDRSRRIELLFVESLAKIKPTDPKKAAAKKSKLVRFLQ